LITLENILKRNKKSLLEFIQKNKLTSYNELLEYCKRRKFTPCKEEDYNQVANDKNKNEKQRSNWNKKSAGGETSEAQKKRKARNSSKRKQTTPKLPDSDVWW